MAPSLQGWGGRPAGGPWGPSAAWGTGRAYLLSTWLVAWFKASLRMEFSCCRRASCALGPFSSCSCSVRIYKGIQGHQGLTRTATLAARSESSQLADKSPEQSAQPKAPGVLARSAADQGPET